MTPINPQVRRGEIYWLDWNPARGAEQAGRRPGLIIQENPANANPNYPLTIVVAISTKGRGRLSHVEIASSPRNGLRETSYVKCQQIQTVSKQRLEKRIGELEAADMARVDAELKLVLSLP